MPVLSFYREQDEIDKMNEYNGWNYTKEELAVMRRENWAEIYKNQKCVPMGDPTVKNPYPRYPTNMEIYNKWKKGEYTPTRTKEFPGYREPPQQKPGEDRHGNRVDLRTAHERNARRIRGEDRQVFTRAERDIFGNVDEFDQQGLHVVNYEMIEDWEDTPMATKWSPSVPPVLRAVLNSLYACD